MDNIKLIKPCERYLLSYLEACRELKSADISANTFHNPDDFFEWKDNIFQRFEKNSQGTDLPEGYVPMTTYWLVDELNYIGSGSIRHYLNENLKKFGGHIGYFIRPTFWNMGYGTLQLRLLLLKANELGIDNALLTCDVENHASARIMEKNGGKRIDEIEVEVAGTMRKLYRYEIKTESV